MLAFLLVHCRFVTGSLCINNFGNNMAGWKTAAWDGDEGANLHLNLVPLWFRTKASISCRINTCALGLRGQLACNSEATVLPDMLRSNWTATSPSLLWIQSHVSKIFCTIMVPCILFHASPCCSNLYGPIPDRN